MQSGLFRLGWKLRRDRAGTGAEAGKFHNSFSIRLRPSSVLCHPPSVSLAQRGIRSQALMVPVLPREIRDGDQNGGTSRRVKI